MPMAANKPIAAPPIACSAPNFGAAAFVLEAGAAAEEDALAVADEELAALEEDAAAASILGASVGDNLPQSAQAVEPGVWMRHCWN